jgi:hypothetical protein
MYRIAIFADKEIVGGVRNAGNALRLPQYLKISKNLPLKTIIFREGYYRIVNQPNETNNCCTAETFLL